VRISFSTVRCWGAALQVKYMGFSLMGNVPGIPHTHALRAIVNWHFVSYVPWKVMFWSLVLFYERRKNKCELAATLFSPTSYPGLLEYSAPFRDKYTHRFLGGFISSCGHSDLVVDIGDYGCVVHNDLQLYGGVWL